MMGDVAEDMFDEALIERPHVDEDLPEIEFDEESHIYRVKGDIKRSVTQTFKDKGICDYSGCDPYYADRGTRAHDGCTDLARGVLTWSGLQDDIVGYVRTFEGLVWALGLEYISSEQPCYDKEYDVAGKYDLIMKWRGKRTLVELKTGNVEQYHGLQIAWYERMTGAEDVLGLSLKGGGKVYVKADDWQKNHEVLNDIHTGKFDLDTWKKDKKRRRMKVLKEIA